MLGLAAALLATTASAELWIPSIFSGSGKTAPVHQPHGSAHPTRAAAAGERDDTRGSAHKLRGNFGTGIVVPADDAEVPKTPDPVDVPKIDVMELPSWSIKAISSKSTPISSHPESGLKISTS